MSLGKDLASIRNKQNLTLEDIQNEIKIPLHTLKSIEDGTIFTDSGESKTYIRSFVRSYAKVLGIEDVKIVHALNEVEAGTYSGSLLSDAGTLDGNYTEAENIKSQEPSPKKKPPENKEKQAAHRPKPKPVHTTDIDTVNWADLGKQFSTVRQNSNIWVIISFFVVLTFIILTSIFYWDTISTVFNDENEPIENEAPVNEPDTSEDSPLIPMVPDTLTGSAQLEAGSELRTPENNEPFILTDTLTVTVYAAFEKLEPVRVTSDFNWKTNPFWMEQGEAFNFEFRDSLLIDGQYSRMLLLFNGHIIENPRQSYFDEAFNAILITRSILDQPQYLEPAPAEFPLEIGAPDSTEYVIRY